MSGIDHLVLAVADLELARSRYASLGFTTTPEARHPFGTGNSLVQLEERAFIELVTVKSPEAIPDHGSGRFSFAAFNRDFLKRGEGFSMLVLESSDARADLERFRAAGLVTHEPFDFSRKAKLPTGEEATVGFSLAFVSHPEMPDVGFFTCQQHSPEHFWKSEYQVHANTAYAVSSVWLVAQQPLDFAEFLQTFADAEDVTAADDRLDVETGRGRILAVTEAAFEQEFGVAPATAGRCPCLAAYVLGVRDLDAVSSKLDGANIRTTVFQNKIVVAADTMFGTLVAFKEE